MPQSFDLQGHRGARALRPENTLPSFEAALDAGVTSIETDLHLTRDGVPVLFHDPFLSNRLGSALDGAELNLDRSVPTRGLTLAQLRRFRVDRNPDPIRFPHQQSEITPLSRCFAQERGIDPLGVPTLQELFDFAAAYAGNLGWSNGKSDMQRAGARSVRFDLELKRVPFHPEYIGDAFDGSGPGLLEQRVAELIEQANVLPRTQVRSFDHRCLPAMRQLLPGLLTCVVVAATAPVDSVQLARSAGASAYAPSFDFLDEDQIRKLHAAGIKVLPWTVNVPEDLVRLLEWGVDGVTTDDPSAMAGILRERGVTFWV